MSEKQFSGTLSAALLVAAVLIVTLLSVPDAWAASKERVLYRFCSLSNCTDGDGPQAGLISDATENLYGTTGSSGRFNNEVRSAFC